MKDVNVNFFCGVDEPKKTQSLESETVPVCFPSLTTGICQTWTQALLAEGVNSLSWGLEHSGGRRSGIPGRGWAWRCSTGSQRRRRTQRTRPTRRSRLAGSPGWCCHYTMAASRCTNSTCRGRRTQEGRVIKQPSCDWLTWLALAVQRVFTCVALLSKQSKVRAYKQSWRRFEENTANKICNSLGFVNI